MEQEQLHIRNSKEQKIIDRMFDDEKLELFDLNLRKESPCEYLSYVIYQDTYKAENYFTFDESYYEMKSHEWIKTYLVKLLANNKQLFKRKLKEYSTCPYEQNRQLLVRLERNLKYKDRACKKHKI